MKGCAAAAAAAGVKKVEGVWVKKAEGLATTMGIFLLDQGALERLLWWTYDNEIASWMVIDRLGEEDGGIGMWESAYPGGRP